MVIKEDKQKESYKKKKRSFVKKNYNAMKFFNETEWTKMKELKHVQDKYDLFLLMYKGDKEYVKSYK